MSRQVSRGSAGEYQADEQAGVSRLSWRRGADHVTVPSVLGTFRGAGEEGVLGPDLCPTSTALTVVWGLG